MDRGKAETLDADKKVKIRGKLKAIFYFGSKKKNGNSEKSRKSENAEFSKKSSDVTREQDEDEEGEKQEIVNNGDEIADHNDVEEAEEEEEEEEEEENINDNHKPIRQSAWGSSEKCISETSSQPDQGMLQDDQGVLPPTPAIVPKSSKMAQLWKVISRRNVEKLNKPANEVSSTPITRHPVITNSLRSERTVDELCSISDDDVTGSGESSPVISVGHSLSSSPARGIYPQSNSRRQLTIERTCSDSVLSSFETAANGSQPIKSSDMFAAKSCTALPKHPLTIGQRFRGVFALRRAAKRMRKNAANNKGGGGGGGGEGEGVEGGVGGDKEQQPIRKKRGIFQRSKAIETKLATPSLGSLEYPNHVHNKDGDQPDLRMTNRGSVVSISSPEQPPPGVVVYDDVTVVSIDPYTEPLDSQCSDHSSDFADKMSKESSCELTDLVACNRGNEDEVSDLDSIADRNLDEGKDDRSKDMMKTRRRRSSISDSLKSLASKTSRFRKAVLVTRVVNMFSRRKKHVSSVLAIQEDDSDTSRTSSPLLSIPTEVSDHDNDAENSMGHTDKRVLTRPDVDPNNKHTSGSIAYIGERIASVDKSAIPTIARLCYLIIIIKLIKRINFQLFIELLTYYGFINFGI